MVPGKSAVEGVSFEWSHHSTEKLELHYMSAQLFLQATVVALPMSGQR